MRLWLLIAASELVIYFTYQTQLDIQHGGVYLVAIDRQFSDIIVLYL